MSAARQGTAPHWDAVVFAGGGNRCLWSAGFYSVLAQALDLRPRVLTGSSAGATMACMLSADKTDVALEHFTEATRANRRNVYPWRALRRQPMFPHYAMYRHAVLTSIDAEALARIHAGPDIRVQLTRLPPRLGPRTGALVGLVAYTVEKKWRNPVHPKAGARVGFRSEVASVRTCRTPDDLADLLLASSCTPPFTPVLEFGGAPVLDGGVFDNVPVGPVGPGLKTLVLLTRPYDRLPDHPDRTYVQPSRPIPISKFDYTNPDGLHLAWNMGREDASRMLDTL